jgi:glycosyltransferase involved in cell wall biosynthesis
MGAHIRKIAEGSEITLVADGVSDLSEEVFGAAVCFHDLAISRKINLSADASALFRLWRFFRQRRFNCVHSIMPKAGLLSMLAAVAAAVPCRFHTFTGQVWVTRTGIARWFLMLMDRLIATLATGVITDSLSQRDFLIAHNIVRPEKISVLGKGSITGVDTLRFVPDPIVRANGRRDLGICDDDFVFLFVGRLTRDKGVNDLLKAFAEIAGGCPDIHLLLVGPDEDGYDSCIANLAETLRQRIHSVGFTDRPEQFMAISDVICLPSYREGFGSVLIEAASAELPAIASRIYGISDAVVDGVTGVMHEPGDVSEIVLCMSRLAKDQPLRRRMGIAARARAIEDFSEELLTAAFCAYYRKHGVLSR